MFAADATRAEPLRSTKGRRELQTAALEVLAKVIVVGRKRVGLSGVGGRGSEPVGRRVWRHDVGA
eukprot:760781-Pleurochrysis_carterae.AAC.1